MDAPKRCGSDVRVTVLIRTFGIPVTDGWIYDSGRRSGMEREGVYSDGAFYGQMAHEGSKARDARTCTV